MNIENQKITLDINQRNHKLCYGIKGDIGTRIVDIYITQGEAIVDLTGVQVLLYALTPNEDKLYHDISITNAKLGKLTFTIPQQILQQKDMTTCCLVFREGQKQLISYEFFVQVTDSIYNENAIITGDDFSALNVALDKVEKYDKELQDASTNLEQKYTVRLNEFDAQLDNNVQELNKFRQGGNSNLGKCKVLIIDDDGSSEFLTKIKPIYDKANIKCSVAINASTIGTSGKMTWDDIKNLKANGFEILNHSFYNMPPANVDDVYLKDSYEKEKAIFLENGLDTYDYFVYPGSMPWSDINLKNRLKKFYKCCFAIADAPYNKIPFDNFAIHRRGFNGGLTSNKHVIDKYVQMGGFLVLFGHAYMPTDTVENYQSIVDYLISLGNKIEFVTAKDMIEKYGNVIELGSNENKGNNFFVSKNGQTNIRTMEVSTETLNYNRGIDTYEPYFVTVKEVYGDGSYTEIPFKNGCVLRTVRMGDDRFSYQEASILNSSNIYIRYWNSSTNAWREFYSVAGSTPFNMSYEYKDLPLTSYTPLTTTVQAIDYSLATSIGLQEGGIIKTYRFAEPMNNYGYQEYHRIGGTADIRTRGWNTSTNAWRPWTQFAKV